MPAASPPRPLLVLVGPTAGGKESSAVHAAPTLHAELVVVDSVKLYRGLGIASAAPPQAHAERVPHHLVGTLDPSERLHAARWGELAERAITDIRDRGKRPLLVGGTALYLKAFLFGLFEGPARNDALRAELAAEETAQPGSLHARLARVDPEAAARLHPNDHKRLLRAVEVFDATGRPISELQVQWKRGQTEGPKRPYRAVGLVRSRDDLRSRIALRVERMLEQGLLDEIRALLAPGRLGPTAVEAIGVKELLPVLRAESETGQLDPQALAEALEQIRNHTWQLARRQTVWWRRFPDVTWLDVAPDEPADITGKRVADALRDDRDVK